MKEFNADSINDLVSNLGGKFEIAVTNGGQLNFDQSFLHFNVKWKLYAKLILNLTVNTEY